MHRLTRREHDCTDSVVEGTVPTACDLDADAVHLLDLGRSLGERADQRVTGRNAVAVQPAAELALLPARERGDALRLGCVALDQGQRLQDGVVHPGGHLGAFFEPDALGAVGGDSP